MLKAFNNFSSSLVYVPAATLDNTSANLFVPGFPSEPAVYKLFLCVSKYVLHKLDSPKSYCDVKLSASL